MRLEKDRDVGGREVPDDGGFIIHTHNHIQEPTHILINHPLQPNHLPFHNSSKSRQI